MLLLWQDEAGNEVTEVIRQWMETKDVGLVRFALKDGEDSEDEMKEVCEGEIVVADGGRGVYLEEHRENGGFHNEKTEEFLVFGPATEGGNESETVGASVS